MTVKEDVLTKLTTEPVTKINGEPGQGDIKLLEQEMAEKAAKIEATEDVIQKVKKIRFLVVIKTTEVWHSH